MKIEKWACEEATVWVHDVAEMLDVVKVVNALKLMQDDKEKIK